MRRRDGAGRWGGGMGGGAVFLYVRLHPVLRERGLMAPGGGGGGSKYMKGYHFHVKSISMGYLFHPKSIWMGKIWKVVYEWVQFSLKWEVYECVCFLISPSIWMGWGRGLQPQFMASYPPPPPPCDLWGRVPWNWENSTSLAQSGNLGRLKKT